MRENIFKNSHIIQKTLFIYKGLLFQLKGGITISIDFYIDLDRVGQAAIGGSLLFHFYYFPFATRQSWSKTISRQNLETKFLKENFFVDRKAGVRNSTTT